VAWRSTTEAYSSPWKVALVASTPTTPRSLNATAGFTAGSMPTKGVPAKRSRSGRRAAAEALLQATTTGAAPRLSSSSTTWIERSRTSSRVRSP